jgi:PH domain
MTDPRRSSLYSPEVRDNLEFSGLLQKRRGGFGRYALGGSWQERFVTISKQGLLTYYEGDPYESHNDDHKEKPRGRIDLRSVNYDFFKDIRSEVFTSEYRSLRIHLHVIDKSTRHLSINPILFLFFTDRELQQYGACKSVHQTKRNGSYALQKKKTT